MKNYLKVLNWIRPSVYYAIGSIIVVVPIVASLFRGEIHCDSAYFLCSAQLVANGMTPYVDFAFGYAPLWLYIAAALKLLFRIPDGSYVFYLVLHYLFVIGSAFFLYKVLLEWKIDKNKALIGIGLYLIMSYWLQGNLVLLEAPSIFFGLWSTLLVLRAKRTPMYLLAGLICACSFLCKQYGLGFLFLNLYLIILMKRGAWQESVLFVAGYSVLIVLCFIYWKDSFIPVIFSEYGTKSAVERGLDVSFTTKTKAIAKRLGYFAVWVCPATIVSLFSIPTAYRQRHLLRMIYCYCGIIGFALQFYFAGDLHYFLYMVPFGILLMMEWLSIGEKSWLQKFKQVIVVWTIVFSLYKTYKCRVYKWYVQMNVRQYQYDIANDMRLIIPPKTCLYVVDNDMQYLYFVLQVLPPNLSTISFAFGRLGINEQEQIQQIKSADFVVFRTGDIQDDNSVVNKMSGYLNKYQSYSAGGDGWFLIYDMRNVKQ